MTRTRGPIAPRKSGDPGYTPSEYDFCHCGATYQPIEGSRARMCPKGHYEGERRSFHKRTGLPYVGGAHQETLL